MAEEDAPRRPAPQIQPVFTWPTPEKSDLLFFVENGGNLPKNKHDQWNYGDPFPDNRKYPNHKLIYVSPETPDKWSRWFYMADRANQDDYNYEFTAGEQLVRTYVVLRSKYFMRNAVQAAAVSPVVPDEFTVPVVATPDTKFADFAFADDTLGRTDTELDSLYVVIRRRFVIPVTREIRYDDAMDLDVVTTRTLISKTTVVAASTSGNQREREHGNVFHDWQVVTQVGTVTYPGGVFTLTPPTYPVSLESIPTHVNYSFPPLLRSVTIVAAWAYADSSQAARSYDEAYYFDFDLVKPTNGPFEARKLRFVTDDPDSLRSRFPVDKIITVQETIGITRAWFSASDKGNSTFAEARQLEVPESIHDDLTIANAETLAVGQNKNSLPATPGFRRFEALTSMIIGYEPSKARYGLYIVEVLELNVTGIYDGNTVPFGTEGGSTGATTPPPPAYGAPILPTVIMALDNTSVSGVTTPFAEVQAKVGSVFYGRSVANEAGGYSITLDPVVTDAVTVNVTARSGGISSGVMPVSTYDLAPDAPDAVINATLDRVSGVTEPNAAITILKNAVAQVETLTIQDALAQQEAITFVGAATADGQISLTVSWPGMVGTPINILFGVLDLDTPTQIAGKAVTAVNGDAGLSAFLVATNVGPQLLLTARVVAADEATADIAYTNDTPDPGTTPVSGSTTTVAGNTPMTITTAGTAVLTLTTGIAGATTPLEVPFAVEVGDDADDVAAKAEAALELSAADDNYIPASSTNNVSLTARVVAANDIALNLAIENGTCVGLVEQATSTGTTPGGTAYSTTANGAGAYAYTFSPALSSGDILLVTATDSGGTSEGTSVKASATPPTLTSAIFPADVFNRIEGVATVAAKVIAYLGDTEIGDAIADGSGDFEITLATGLTHGEEVRVVAVIDGDEEIRSSIRIIEANNLDLDPPVLTYYPDSNTYAGTAEVPNGMDAYYPVSFNVLAAATAASVAQSAVDALTASDVNDFYVITRSVADIVLTARMGIVYNRHLNLSLTAGNGVTGVSFSTSTGSAVSPQEIRLTVAVGVTTAGVGQVILTSGALSVAYQLASGGPVTGNPITFGTGNYAFILPTRDGARYKVYYIYPQVESDPVYIYATIAPLPALRFWPMAYRTAEITPTTAVITRKHSTIAAYRETYFNRYNNYQNQVGLSGRSGVFFIYIPFWYSGMTVTISYPGQATPTVVDTPADPGDGYDVRYTLGTTTLPQFVDVTVALADGRSVSAFFDRASNFAFMVYDSTT